MSSTKIFLDLLRCMMKVYWSWLDPSYREGYSVSSRQLKAGFRNMGNLLIQCYTNLKKYGMEKDIDNASDPNRQTESGGNSDHGFLYQIFWLLPKRHVSFPLVLLLFQIRSAKLDIYQRVWKTQKQMAQHSQSVRKKTQGNWTG